MPRGYRGSKRAKPEVDDWGAVVPDQEPDTEEVEDDPDDEQPSPPSEQIVALGQPPTDVRGGQTWAYRLQLVLAHEAAVDPGITKSQRRRDVPRLLAGAAKFFPDALRQEARDRIGAADERRATKRKERAKAELEPLPPPGDARVIPIRRG